jgi:hypothetical protein
LDRRTSAQLLNLRNRLALALLPERASQAGAAQQRILEQGFFEPPGTPRPARVISLVPALPASRPPTRF